MLQKACTAMAGSSLPVQQSTQVAYQPNTVVYSIWKHTCSHYSRHCST
jgi:hypothetical protein